MSLPKAMNNFLNNLDMEENDNFYNAKNKCYSIKSILRFYKNLN